MAEKIRLEDIILKTTGIRQWLRRRWMTAKWRIKGHWPLMTKKAHRAEIARRLEDQRRMLDSENQKEREMLGALIRPLTKVVVERPSYDTYRCSVYFTTPMFQAFDRGGESAYFRYIAEALSREVHRELCTINFSHIYPRP